MAAAAMWGALTTVKGRLVAFSAATLAVTLLSPIVRNLSILSAFPDPIEAYLRPVGGLSNFVFFPWAGFVFAGAIVGLILDGLRTRRQEHLANLGFALAGIALTVAAYELSFLPSWHPQSHFWTTSPAFFFLRVGIMTTAIGIAYAWDLRPGAGGQVESTPATRPDVALHLLDSRRDGLRPPVAAAAQAPVVGAVVGGAGALLPVHAVVLDLQGSGGGEMAGSEAQGSGLRLRRSSSKVSKVLPEP